MVMEKDAENSNLRFVRKLEFAIFTRFVKNREIFQ